MLFRSDGRVRTISVRLSDVNGPRKGVDKRCLLRVRLAQGPQVVIEDVQSDLYAAIGRSADRASRTVARRLARSRNWHAGRDLPASGMEEAG